MEKYLVKDSQIVVEDKTFIDGKGTAVQYQDYSLLVNVEGNTLQLKFDKSSKSKIQTLIDIGILKS